MEHADGTKNPVIAHLPGREGGSWGRDLTRGARGAYGSRYLAPMSQTELWVMAATSSACGYSSGGAERGRAGESVREGRKITRNSKACLDWSEKERRHRIRPWRRRSESGQKLLSARKEAASARAPQRTGRRGGDDSICTSRRSWRGS